ncbi:nucleotidyltransferase domain-containing protein [Salipaludibacillus agaradhaerens]|uniref:nucleotidyltransferase domain-containing protein n=1 Tax=Salipaludibacillus agaradhaerens TaxID=76935 RepID=UPI002150C76F|nr:nucleotidyltransferase domain-containing protein [Salipaludibacillus agaradhaerens]MCR6105618.1 nucleotidyltransferase domain-containing protein [Salipaludibacillus agaradhaerens]MCR6117655.1 nucleotidyltransferase domain-containing protein [Salipaludibacillus agaradhaerens]
MSGKTGVLRQTALRFLEKWPHSISYATAGGSLGRGDADAFSDIDITIYCEDNLLEETHVNKVYEDEIIQLTCLHTRDLPSEHDIYRSPWHARFLTEILILKDTEERFSHIKQVALDHLTSANGLITMTQEVTAIVNQRMVAARQALKRGMGYSAAMSALGAWAEAAFLYLYVTWQSCATQHVLPCIRTELNAHYTSLIENSPFQRSYDSVSIVKKYRAFLRKYKGDAHSLAPLHDELCERKAQRLQEQQDPVNVTWHMYGEVIWLYFETSKGIQLDSFVGELPLELKHDLATIGLTPFREKQVETLGQLTEQLIKKVHIIVNRTS